MAGERLMTLAEFAELLGVPVGTLYGWRHQGEGPPWYRIGRHVRYRRSAVEGLDRGSGRPASVLMASIERRDLQRRDKSGRVRTVTRYKGPLSRLGREAAQRDQTPSGRGRAA